MGMSKTQNTNDDAPDTTYSETSKLSTEKTSDDMEGAMRTPGCPPTMNIVDLCDTISDVEESEIKPETSRKHARKSKRRKVKQLIDKAADHDEDNKDRSEEELFHKEPHKPESVQKGHT